MFNKFWALSEIAKNAGIAFMCVSYVKALKSSLAMTKSLFED